MRFASDTLGSCDAGSNADADSVEERKKSLARTYQISYGLPRALKYLENDPEYRRTANLRPPMRTYDRRKYSLRSGPVSTESLLLRINDLSDKQDELEDKIAKLEADKRARNSENKRESEPSNEKPDVVDGLVGLLRDYFLQDQGETPAFFQRSIFPCFRQSSRASIKAATEKAKELELKAEQRREAILERHLQTRDRLSEKRRIFDQQAQEQVLQLLKEGKAWREATMKDLGDEHSIVQAFYVNTNVMNDVKTRAAEVNRRAIDCNKRLLASSQLARAEKSLEKRRQELERQQRENKVKLIELTDEQRDIPLEEQVPIRISNLSRNYDAIQATFSSTVEQAQSLLDEADNLYTLVEETKVDRKDRQLKSSQLQTISDTIDKIDHFITDRTAGRAEFDKSNDDDEFSEPELISRPSSPSGSSVRENSPVRHVTLEEVPDKGASSDNETEK